MKKRRFWPIACLLVLLLAAILVIYRLPWGFARQVSGSEEALRLAVVQTAQGWLGAKESDGTHQAIVDLYNTQQPLPRGYPVTYEDAWCATFGSTVAIQCELTDIIPTECGCDPQIALFQQLDSWEEADDYIPLPGDYIFYHWDCKEPGDCTGSTDHVGIVTGTCGRYIRVIEGNLNDRVQYHYVRINDPEIRGYGIPDYGY